MQDMRQSSFSSYSENSNLEVKILIRSYTSAECDQSKSVTRDFFVSKSDLKGAQAQHMSRLERQDFLTHESAAAAEAAGKGITCVQVDA
jgi:hypothetical protein